ncbi:MAG: N-acetylmuramoyl-L-alanine amidase [Thermonemataceae bacterium]
MITSSFLGGEVNKNYQYKVKTIVIDAGHGGKDPGTLGSNTKEKDIALAVALELGKTINKYLPDVKVVYTRTTDEFVELYKRAELANRSKADIFISIHCNSVNASPAKKQTIYGTEVYVMGQHVSEENLSVARRENKAILLEEGYQQNYQGFDPNSTEGYIMLALMQSAYLENSLKLAEKIDQQFSTRAKRKSRGIKQAGFVVLKQSTSASVLVEIGFISNLAEEKYLNDGWGQTVIASALFRAIRDYKKEIESIGND